MYALRLEWRQRDRSRSRNRRWPGRQTDHRKYDSKIQLFFPPGCKLEWFDVSAFFQGIGKRDWYPSSSSSSQGANSFWGYSFPSTSFIEKSFPETVGQKITEMPSSHASEVINLLRRFTRNSQWPYIQNIAYLRFKNLSIGYTLPINKRFFRKSPCLLFQE